MAINWHRLIGCEIQYEKYKKLDSSDIIQFRKWVVEVEPDEHFDWECVVYFSDGESSIMLDKSKYGKDTFIIISHGRRLLIERIRNSQD